MSRDLDRKLRQQGTRFRLFPQSPSLPAFLVPEPVYIASPPGSIAAGPLDARMYVVDPVRKDRLYGYPYLPPYTGAVRPPARPNRYGHFDTFGEGTREFCAAHMFGVVRRVLDIWEDYLGHEVRWHFADLLPSLELIPLVEWENAQSGFGFIETGHTPATSSVSMPYCLSFDVLAHELGHAILFAELGVPVGAARTGQFLAFHEAMADLIALVVGAALRRRGRRPAAADPRQSLRAQRLQPAGRADRDRADPLGRQHRDTWTSCGRRARRPTAPGSIPPAWAGRRTTSPRC